MGPYRAAVLVALLAAVVAACTPFARFRSGDLQTGSVAPQEMVVEDAAETPDAAVAPSFATFEATEPASGLRCTGGYNPLQASPTFTAAVICDDGRTGEVTAAKPQGGLGTGTLVLSGGGAVTVTIRHLAADADEPPPAAAGQLPAPDPSAYVR